MEQISNFAKFLLSDEEFIRKRIREQIEYIGDLDMFPRHHLDPLFLDSLEKRETAVSRLAYFRERLEIIYAQTDRTK